MIHLKTAHGQKFYEKKVKLFNYAKKHGNVEKYKTYLIGEKDGVLRAISKLLSDENAKKHRFDEKDHEGWAEWNHLCEEKIVLENLIGRH